MKALERRIRKLEAWHPAEMVVQVVYAHEPAKTALDDPGEHRPTTVPRSDFPRLRVVYLNEEDLSL